MFNSSEINKSMDSNTNVELFIASIIILCVNVLTVGLFITFIYVMCSLTPILQTFEKIIKQIMELTQIMDHVNWFNIMTTIVGITILLILMYNIKQMTDDIDTLFKKFTGEIAIKDAKIRQLESALQNATEKWIVGKQM